MSILKKPIKIKYYFIFIEKETCGPIAPYTHPQIHPRRILARFLHIYRMEAE